MLAFSAAAFGPQANAGNYTASTEQELRDAITAANGDTDPSATITLTGNVTMASTTAFPTATKPVTINTGPFTLSGFDQTSGTTAGGNVTFSGVTIVNSGNLVGGDAFSATTPSNGQGGIGLSLTNGSLANNGTITGGVGGDNPGIGASPGGVGVALTGGSHVNNGTITGGVGGLSSGDGSRGGGGGLTLSNGSLTNNGTIQAGPNTGSVSSGASVAVSGTTTLANNGTIRGGVGGLPVSPNSNAGLSVSGTATVTNTGTIEGGIGGPAITVAPFGTHNLTLINSGTIRSGGVAAAAITFGSAAGATSVLELHPGSVIEGNVLAPSANANDTFRLGGAGDSTFDVSTLGTQYVGFSTFEKTGTSTWTLTGTTTAATGWRLRDGALVINSNQDLGTGVVTFDGGTLRNTIPLSAGRNVTINAGGGTFQTDADLTWAGVINGPGALTKTGSGTLILTLGATPGGGATIAAGTLQIGNGGSGGGLIGNVVNNGNLAFNRGPVFGTPLSLNGVISGSGTVTQLGTSSSVTVLNGNNTYTGATYINGGTLRINGNQSAATGLVTVASGGRLGGSGIIGGAVTVADGGRLAPGNSPGTLTMGALTLSSGSILDFELGEANVASSTLNDLINVNGDLTLDGTLNVALSAGGTYGAGIYRLINYTGALTDNGLELGLTPASSANYLQTSVANQVNLINTQGLVLSYWDAAASARNDGQIAGGSGVWQAAGNDNWTTADGSINADHQDASMAIFGGSAGTITVDDSLGAINVSGLQFASDGYRLEGDAINLGAGLNTVRVGDGTDAGAGFVATIASELAGSGTLEKTDLGMLVLTGNNTYTGGTTVSAGTLQVGDGGTSGSLTGDITNDGTLAFNRSDAATFAGVISGNGTLAQRGSGTTTLAATGSQATTLNVESGTFELGSGASFGAQTIAVAAGATLRNGGTLNGTIGSDTLTIAGTLTGNAVLLDGDDEVQIAASANIGQASFDGGAGIDLLDVTRNDAWTLPSTFATNFEALMKRGSGAFTLEGDVAGFADRVAIAGGTANLANATVQTSDFHIEAGAALTGVGLLSGNLHNAGLLSPGNSPGTIHVGGNYVQDADATLVSEILRTGSDRLDIAGSAMLAGAHQINVEYGLYLDGTTHALINAAGGINGQFQSVTITPSALMTADHQVSTSGASVNFTRQATTTITNPNTNQSRYAQWLDEQIAAGGLAPAMIDYIDLLLQQPTAAQAKSLLGEVSEPAAAVSQSSVSTLGAGYARAVFDRFAMADGVQCVATQASSDARSCGWMQGLRQWGDADGDRFGAGYDWTTDGAQFGFDRQLEAMTVGFSFGYGDTDIDDAHGARNTLRSKIGALYGSYTAGRIGVDALLLYADHDNRTRRNVVIGADTQHARAEFDSNSSGIGARIGYRLTSETSPLVRPFAELYYDHIDGAQFAERGARTGNLLVRIHERSGLRGTAGLQWADSYEGFGHVLRPSLEAAIAHQFNDTQSMLDVRPVAGADAFRTYGSQLDRTAYLAKASLEISLASNALVKIGYSGELADDYSHHQAELGLRVVW